ncbi:CG1136 [Drosophila busckii]|uniref:CG1136 n=1 Tax=Drosophila busckii TaxID=30019 RepID=A0A0M4EMM3_DROBS|nr:CG1136 [Drosophila busckii]
MSFAAALVSASWGEAGQSQYHIQTDEGPERYFRFQTDNGQFRKEKRLQDGTVIGTEAWIDAAGFLRQKDYIADKEGYRILKSKTIYVGTNRGIEDAIKSTKSAPAQSGVLVDGNAGGNSVAGGYRKHSYVSSSTTAAPPPALYEPPKLGTVDLGSGVGKLNYLPPEQAAKLEPSNQLGFDHYPDELPRARQQLQRGQLTPLVHIQPNAEPIDDLNAIYDAEADHAYGSFGSTTPSTPIYIAPELSMLPPVPQRRRQRPRPTAIGIISSTPSPIAAQQSFGYSTPAPFAAPGYATPLSGSSGSSGSGYDYYTPNSPLEVNALDAALLPPLPARAYRRRLRPLHSNNLDATDYGGNGYRYVLPKQYHEEAQVGDKRAGSYGYVDPFGIRRVVYYNAAPGRGFVHRNNNQFVGANGAPYDDPGPAQLVNE